jgi:hypothetical protein
MQSNGTGPTSRQLQDKVGGVTPAGLSLELLDIVRLVTTPRAIKLRCRYPYPANRIVALIIFTSTPASHEA